MFVFGYPEHLYWQGWKRFFGLAHCGVLKVFGNEIQWFTSEQDFDAGIEKLREQYQIPLILRSIEKEGSRAYYKDFRVEMKPFLRENTIETIGTGDMFGACCLNYALKYGIVKTAAIKDEAAAVQKNAEPRYRGQGLRS